MITTVITSTITSITTTSMMVFGVGLGLVAVIALIVFLFARQLATSGSNSPRFLAKSLDVSIVPLLIVFALIVGIKAVEILG